MGHLRFSAYLKDPSDTNTKNNIFSFKKKEPGLVQGKKLHRHRWRWWEVKPMLLQ